MRLRLLAVAAVLPATVACLDTLEAPNGRLGMIVMETYESAATYVAKPIATFYDKTNAGFSVVPTDTCFISLFGPVGGTSIATMGVGDAISMLLPGRTELLTPDTLGSYIWYKTDLATGIEFTPGDTVQMQVPGNGTTYPAVNVTVRTAEEFDHDPVIVPADGENLQLTWTAAPEPGSIMSFSLRYSAPGTNTGLLNQQVFCGLVDDGSHLIPAGLLAGWRTSVGDLRETKATRLRYSQVDVDTRSKIALISTFSRPIQPPPAP